MGTRPPYVGYFTKWAEFLSNPSCGDTPAAAVEFDSSQVRSCTDSSRSSLQLYPRYSIFDISNNEFCDLPASLSWRVHHFKTLF